MGVSRTGMSVCNPAREQSGIAMAPGKIPPKIKSQALGMGKVADGWEQSPNEQVSRQTDDEETSGR